MDFSTAGLAKPSSGGTYQGNGIFADVATIVRVEDHSYQPPPFGGDPKDLAVNVVLDVGASFEVESYIGGNFSRDNEGAIEKWGGAFFVAQFFARIGIEDDLNTDDPNAPTIPADWLEQAQGRKVIRLSYCAGWNKDNTKPKYYTWNTFLGLNDVDPDDDVAVQGLVNELITEFNKSVEKGYPSNYNPAVAEEYRQEYSKEGASSNGNMSPNAVAATLPSGRPPF